MNAVKAIDGKFSSSLCCGSALDGLLQQVLQASDIGLDGTQDPMKTCDGVAIGLGYETTTSKMGNAAPPSAVMDSCAGTVCP